MDKIDYKVLSESELKGVQKIEKDMLSHFIQICDKHKLTYYITYGTLIGVVRHKGFIPWDDDIDVLMPRADYDQFNQIAQNELPSYLFLQNKTSDPEYLGGFSKIRNSDTTFIEINNVNKKMNHGIYIDIFPLDNCPSSRLGNILFNIRKRFLFLRTRTELVIVEGAIRHNKRISILIDIASKCLKVVWPDLDKLYSETEAYLRRRKETGRVCNFYSSSSRYRYDAKWFKNTTLLPFEDLKVCVPEGYYAFLRFLYGDYLQLPPADQRKTRHFTKTIDYNKSYKDYCNY